MGASVTQLPTRPPEEEEASDQALVRLVQSLPRGSDFRDAACEALVARYQSLVRACAPRYWQSPERQEELMQVGYVARPRPLTTSTPPSAKARPPPSLPHTSSHTNRHPPPH